MRILVDNTNSILAHNQPIDIVTQRAFGYADQFILLIKPTMREVHLQI